MAKFLKENGANAEFGINGGCFVVDTSSENIPLFSIDTKFVFYQQENLLFIEYTNQYIEDGEMFGAFEENSKLLFYNHTNKDNGIRERGTFTFEMKHQEIKLSPLGHTRPENHLGMNEILILKPCP